MFRSSLVLALGAALLSAGCVPVTEPVGAVDRAEPDKNLVGTWTVTDSGETAKSLDVKEITVDVPEVKGNPKGLLRAVLKPNDSETWFFITTVDKRAYVSLILAPNETAGPPKFGKEGAFEEWTKAQARRFYVLRYTRDGDNLTLDCGNNAAFTALMKDEKIKKNDDTPIGFYETPTGWLAKYLDKTGPAKLFDKTNYLELKRKKK
jgi:hypothetical protein